MEQYIYGKGPSEKDLMEIIQKLLSIHNEDELTEFIETDNFFSNFCEWLPIGGNTDNIRFIGNQQTTAAGTLTEIVVNSIDALLILECIKSGKDPSEPGVPENMNKASELYFGIPEGIIYKCYPPGVLRLSNKVKSSKGVPITSLADNINILFLKSDSKEQNKTIVVYDKGTGQTPQKFKDTFLYHKTDNKLKIPFVQGKYGMGGSGIISRCGLKKYVFILSSRHPDVCTPSERNRWGFTLIRKHVGSIREKRDYYEYLSKKGTGNEIFSLISEKIPNALSGILISDDGKKTIAAPINPIEYGTYLKFYNFELGFTDVRDVEGMFDISLYNPVLPAKIDDGSKFRDHGFSWYLIGGKTRFLTRKWINPEYEEGVDIEFTTKHDIKFTGKVLIFNNYVRTGDKSKNFKLKDFISQNKNVSVLLTYNGQTHATLDRRFLGQFNYSYIKDKILIVCDFRDIMENHRELRTEFFTADRERLFVNKYTKGFKSSLKSTLENDAILKKINEQYHQEKLEENKIDENFEDYLEEFLNRNEELKSIFQEKAEDFLKLTGNIKKLSKEKKKKIPVKKEEPIVVDEDFIEKSSDPRILEWITKKLKDENQIEKKVKTNYKSFLLQLKTDADLGDLLVESHSGVDLEEGEKTRKEKIWTKEPSKSLSKGILTLTFYPTRSEKIGERKVISISLLGKDGGKKIEKIAHILFDEPVIKEEDIKDDNVEEVITFPALIPIKDTDPKWEDDNWNDELISKKEGSEIYISLSSKYFKRYEEKQSKTEHKDSILQDYKLFAYFYTLFYFWDLNKRKGDEVEDIFNSSVKIATISFLSLWRPSK